MIKAKSQTSVLAQASDAKAGKTVFQERKIGSPQSMQSPVDHITGLHSIIGNRAVQGLFQIRGVQARLTIGPANDIYEQEADRVADQVMRMPETAVDEVQRKPG